MMFRFVIRLAAGALIASGFASDAQELKTATSHPIEYYVSLPKGWNEGRTWPVVMIIEAAEREFLKTLKVFENARGDRPFILIAPLVTTNGGANYRQAGTYHYSEETWARVQENRCGFDMDGIAAVAADVRKLYHGDSRYFLTGWEAGGHTVWAVLFGHPEEVRAAAPAVTNYAARCMERGFSNSPVRVNLPVRVFQVDTERDKAPGRYVYTQSQEAMKTAREHGFRNVTESVAAGKPHGPLADEVLEYFAGQIR
jgi:poly(3-hydroxybutyrate) depolymerase